MAVATTAMAAIIKTPLPGQLAPCPGNPFCEAPVIVTKM